MITANTPSNQLSYTNSQVFKLDFIENALVDNKQLTEIDLARLMGFNEEEIRMISLYWNPVFNGSWIYLSDEMILEYLTNETKKNAISHIYERILFE